MTLVIGCKNFTIRAKSHKRLRILLVACTQLCMSLAHWNLPAAAAAPPAKATPAPKAKSTPARKAKSAPTRKPKAPAPKAVEKPPVAVHAAVELPDRSKREHSTVATVAAGELDLKIENPSGNPISFHVIPDDTKTAWTITNDGTRKVAEIKRGGGDLIFAWLDGAREDTECLRNAVLSIQAADNTRLIALRTPNSIDAQRVDLSKSNWVTITEVPLWGLPLRSLKLEATGLADDQPKVEAYYPADRRADFGKRVRVVVHNRAPHAGFQLSLISSDQRPALKFEPLLIDFANKPQPWTLERITLLNNRLVKLIGQQEREIPIARDAAAALTSRLAALKSQFRKDRPDAGLIANAMDDVSSDLVKVKANLADMEAALPVNRNRLQALGPVRDLGTAVHQTARITLRVYYLAGGAEVDVLWVRPDKSPGERSVGLQLEDVERFRELVARKRASQSH